MPRRSRLALATALAVLTAGSARAADVDHIDHEHRLVRIGSTSLHPATLAIGAGDAFGWLNYGDQIAVVSFDATVAASMLCKEKSSFRLTGERIESGDVQARQFVSLCSLAPGTYPYRVEMRAGIGASGGGRGRTLEGTLVVR
jgi:hypothetical protein